MSEVSGVPLDNFRDPIREALAEYSFRTDGRVEFDLNAAADLALTPDKPNSARSVSTVQHLGETAGNLCVIVFDWQDGTGDESAHKLTNQLGVGLFPRETKVMPRSKEGIHSEGHLTIGSAYGNQPDLDPVLFAGSLDLIGFGEDDHLGPTLRRHAILGQDLHEFWNIMHGEAKGQPTVTLTTGYKGNGERFGDPHAVFNSTMAIQVGGFLAVTDQMAAEGHISMLKDLGAVVPTRPQ